MKKIIALIIFVMAALPCAAQFTQSDVVNIDILVPPDEPVIYGDKDVAIVALHYYNDTIAKNSFFMDSLSINQLANSIKMQLEDTPLFSDYDIPIYNYYSDKTKVGKAINTDAANDLYDATGAGIIIAIEAFVADDDLKDVSTLTGRDSKVLESKITCWVRMYDLEKRNILNNYYVRDTIFYFDENASEPISSEDALQETIDVISTNYTQKIAPSWESVDRLVYFAPLNKKSNEGHDFAINQEWDKATEAWTELLDSDKKRNRAIAMYNLALSCEIMGNFDLALQWLEKCKTTDYDAVDADEYINIIKQRIEDKKKLDEI